MAGKPSYQIPRGPRWQAEHDAGRAQSCPVRSRCEQRTELQPAVRIPKVHTKNGRYYYVHANRWHALTRVDEGETALYLALADITSDRPASLGQLMQQYLARGMTELAEPTRKSYRNIIEARLLHAFGHMPVDSLKPKHVAKFLETRKREGHPARGNRERAVLSSVHVFGMRQEWCESNPCLGVKRNTERPRKRYVTDAEFLAAFNASPEPFQDLIAIAYLTGARQGDLRAWKRADMREAGISYVESKTGKRRELAWSDALRFFVGRALKRAQNAESDVLLVNKWGRPWTEWAIHSQLRRLKVTWRFHDLRAKAATDSEHNVLGHRSDMLRVYRRQDRVKPVR